MSAIVHYSFYVESTLGVPAVDLSLQFTELKLVTNNDIQEEF